MSFAVPRPSTTEPSGRGERESSAFASVCHALGDDLGWALGVVVRSYRQASRALFEGIPGGARGYQVLSAAARDATTTQLALARELGIDRTVMTYLIDDLVAGGLVGRRADPADRRARRLLATDAGRALLEDVQQRLRHAEDEVLSPLPDDDRATFREMLQRLATHADRNDPVAPCEVMKDVRGSA